VCFTKFHVDEFLSIWSGHDLRRFEMLDVLFIGFLNFAPIVEALRLRERAQVTK